MTLHERIQALKQEKNVTIVAHYYQPLAVQQVADYIGDSLGLAKITQTVTTPYILFAGVRFMAETASILNQEKKILLPDPRAGCPLADFLTGDEIETFKLQYPGAPVVVYVNTTAETKAHADLCCTSSNALHIVQKAAEIWQSKTILFGPDRHLASYITEQTDLNIISIPGQGNCRVHNRFSVADVKAAREAHPGASLLVHPESPAEVQHEADYIGSTSGMLQYTRDHVGSHGFIIGTENGLVDHLRWKDPSKSFYPLSKSAICGNMKLNTIDKVLAALEAIGTEAETTHEVRVAPDLAQQALRSIEKMLTFS
jgi:quinolinate synthase